jgi:hypothetical protein
MPGLVTLKNVSTTAKIRIEPGFRHEQGPSEFPNLLRMNNPHRRIEIGATKESTGEVSSQRASSQRSPSLTQPKILFEFECTGDV